MRKFPRSILNSLNRISFHTTTQVFILGGISLSDRQLKSKIKTLPFALKKLALTKLLANEKKLQIQNTEHPIRRILEHSNSSRQYSVLLYG